MIDKAQTDLSLKVASAVSFLTKNRYWRGFAASLSLSGLVGGLSYLLYWLFWVRGDDIIRLLLVFGGPLLIPIATGILFIAKRRIRAGMGALSFGAIFISLAVFFLSFGGCTLELRPSVAVAVHDARTGESLTGGSSIVISDGEFSARLHEPTAAFDATERPGIYTVVVSHPGYATWKRRNLRVRQDLYCGHVKTLRLRANLERRR